MDTRKPNSRGEASTPPTTRVWFRHRAAVGREHKSDRSRGGGGLDGGDGGGHGGDGGDGGSAGGTGGAVQYLQPAPRYVLDGVASPHSKGSDT
jgi:hypothetical protein